MVALGSPTYNFHRRLNKTFRSSSGDFCAGDRTMSEGTHSGMRVHPEETDTDYSSASPAGHLEDHSLLSRKSREGLRRALDRRKAAKHLKTGRIKYRLQGPVRFKQGARVSVFPTDLKPKLAVRMNDPNHETQATKHPMVLEPKCLECRTGGRRVRSVAPPSLPALLRTQDQAIGDIVAQETGMRLWSGESYENKPMDDDSVGECEKLALKRHQQALNSRRYYLKHQSEIRMRVKERRARQVVMLENSPEDERNSILEAKRRKQREYSRKHREANRSAINERERERRRRVK
ncbi:hypothetical protein VNI00_016742 [Paramarasmius palmivorus]|uniref:Uncharacterized protein n=1 Tax=Paramarasmius palmivorus TaxID=297713 RepID=A0AAW0BAZ2_9AGAR